MLCSAGARLHQHTDYLEVSSFAGKLPGCAAVGPSNLGVRSRVHQSPHDFRVTLLGGQLQWSAAIVALAGDVGSLFDQVCHYLTGASGSGVQAAGTLPSVEVAGASGPQGPHVSCTANERGFEG